jgi:hypothetical protein
MWARANMPSGAFDYFVLRESPGEFIPTLITVAKHNDNAAG